MLLKCELMLLKCDVMLLKCQINTNTNKNRFLLPTKCLDGVLKIEILILSFNLLHFLFMFANFKRQVCDFYKYYIK